MNSDSLYIYFDSIEKYFPGVKALDNVSFGVHGGTVHALLGENGAGKSTLLKILSGVYTPDSGKIILNDQPHIFTSTREAIRAGIAVIYQELHLVPEMSVAENLLLGHMPTRYGVVNLGKMREDARNELAVLEEDVDSSVKVGTLPIAQRQMVEIAKALIRDAKVIAFDEPTSSLTDREVTRLFTVIRDLKRKGKAIIYVSHRLKEIFEICDSVTVFRDGKVVETLDDVSAVDQDYLVNRMVGRSIRDIYQYSSRPKGGAVIKAEGLFGHGLSEPVNLEIGQGEIVGIFGLVGAGRTELLKLLYGAAKCEAGKISVLGNEVKINNTVAAIRNGIAFCPEDRKKEGIVPLRSVHENINLSVRKSFARFGVVDDKKERENTNYFINKLGIKTSSPARKAMNLSGGNQQKVILARALSGKVKVMLLDEPTRGIDVGAKSEIYGIIGQLASDGIGVIVVSSDLPEVMGISDRILVMRQGKIVASIPREEATEEKLLKLALPAI
ncbi:MAG: L-arabinose ABC transporter ATP-binding protein AraG [Candidatus Latescibacterota bacterium]